MIQRINICNASSWWDEEMEEATEDLLKEYEITRDMIISIVHDHEGKVWLYYII